MLWTSGSLWQTGQQTTQEIGQCYNAPRKASWQRCTMSCQRQGPRGPLPVPGGHLVRHLPPQASFETFLLSSDYWCLCCLFPVLTLLILSASCSKYTSLRRGFFSCSSQHLPKLKQRLTRRQPSTKTCFVIIDRALRMTLQGLWSRKQAEDYGFIHTTPKQRENHQESESVSRSVVSNSLQLRGL